MKFSKTSTFLFGLIASVTSIGTLYISLLQPSPTLTAYVSDGIFYVPKQYDEQIEDIAELTNSFGMQAQIEKLDEDLSYSSRVAISDGLSDSIEQLIRPYFKNGLSYFRSLVYISVHNSGDAVAKDVYIELPEKALLMIEDQSGEYSHPGGIYNHYKIDHLRQDGIYRFWVWFPTETNDLNVYDIKIGSDSQVAKVEYAEIYSGYSALLAKHSKFVYTILFMFIFMFLYMAYEVFTQE